MLNKRLVTLLFVLCTLLFSFSCEFTINVENDKTADCVRDIILENFELKSQITIIVGDDDKILPALYQTHHVSIQLLSRHLRRNKKFGLQFTTEYLIVANSCDDFKIKINRITIEMTWRADAKLLVVFKYNDPRCIFEILLKQRMVNVVVLNDTVSLELYTYNPYEDFGCGKRYNRIIKLGHCKGKHLFYDKFVTGIRNCTFQAVSAHMPPYSIDPATNVSQHRGIEQYVLNVLGDKEGFKINFTYKVNSDDFTIIADNMSAVGPMSALQRGEADIITGAMLLTYERAMAFVYLTGGLTFTDYLQLHVAKAKSVSNLKNTYAGFQGFIWLALFIVFGVYSMLMHLIMHKQPKQAIVLKMFGFFLQQSSQVRGDKIKRVFIFWIFFAYLINCYYHSSLVSFTFHPHFEYQISSLEDILKYNLVPCISVIMRKISKSANYIHTENNDVDCERRNDSLNKVAEYSNYYTIYLRSFFIYEESQYYDAFGTTKIYTIDSPKTQILYAIYFYKGFPFRQKLQHLCRRIDAAGLMKIHFDRLQSDRLVKNKYMDKDVRHFFIPWHVLGFGFTLSIFVFGLEILMHKIYKRVHK